MDNGRVNVSGIVSPLGIGTRKRSGTHLGVIKTTQRMNLPKSVLKEAHRELYLERMSTRPSVWRSASTWGDEHVWEGQGEERTRWPHQRRDVSDREPDRHNGSDPREIGDPDPTKHLLRNSPRPSSKPSHIFRRVPPSKLQFVEKFVEIHSTLPSKCCNRS